MEAADEGDDYNEYDDDNDDSGNNNHYDSLITTKQWKNKVENRNSFSEEK